MSLQKQADLVHVVSCLVKSDYWERVAISMAAAAVAHVKQLADVHQQKISEHEKVWDALAPDGKFANEKDSATQNDAQDAEGEACSDLVLAACAYKELFRSTPTTLGEYLRLLKDMGDEHLFSDVTTLTGWDMPEAAVRKARYIGWLHRTLK